MLIPGLSGHEGRVRRRLAAEMAGLGLTTTTDRLGNLIASAEGDPNRPSVMLFAHMDQLGFVVRKIEPTGFLRLERLGGVPERALGDVSRSAIKQWNPAAFRIEPDPRNARLYERRYAIFRELYPRIRDLMEELSAESETAGPQ